MFPSCFYFQAAYFVGKTVDFDKFSKKIPHEPFHSIMVKNFRAKSFKVSTKYMCTYFLEGFSINFCSFYHEKGFFLMTGIHLGTNFLL